MLKSYYRRVGCLSLLSLLLSTPCVCGQGSQSSPVPVPPEPDNGRALPINLATALALAHARPIDVQVAAERVRLAAAQLDRERYRWLPTIYLGADYARQDGRIQDIVGNVFSTSRQSLMIGAGPSAVFAPGDAILGPLAARQTVAAREAGRQAAVNDATLSVAEAYFNVQQARGELAGAVDAVARAEDLVRRAEGLAEGLAQPVEVNRARTELARRRQAVEAARERWESASADLNRILRLSAAAVVVPAEPPELRIELINAAGAVDDLIPVALTNRPELAAQQALVAATLIRLRQERLRPLVPSVILRGNATNPGGTLSSGTFGGGVDSRMTNFGGRNAVDVQVLWEFQNLGLGNRAAVREREADSQLAVLELFRTQDRVAAEVAQAHAQAGRAAARVKLAEDGLKEAAQTVKTNLDGLGQTRRLGDSLILVFRPQEAVAAVQSLDQAYRDYFGAVADVNRAQFRLYRALGQPADGILSRPGSAGPAPPCPAPEPAAKLVPAAARLAPPGPAAPESDFAADRPR
jgi:outer membrane protein TolC